MPPQRPSPPSSPFEEAVMLSSPGHTCSGSKAPPEPPLLLLASPSAPTHRLSREASQTAPPTSPTPPCCCLSPIRMVGQSPLLWQIVLAPIPSKHPQELTNWCPSRTATSLTCLPRLR